MFSSPDLQALDAELEDGAVLLVPNFPAARQVRDALVGWRLENGAHAVQRTPAVEPVDLWLAGLWRQLAMAHDDARLALSVLEPGQEIVLWRRIVNNSEFSAGLLNPQGTAREAREAWSLALQWRLPLDFVRRLPPDTLEPEGSDFFGDWAWQFERHCGRIEALSFSQMLVHLLSLCTEQADWVRPLLPGKLLLWGFSDSPPLYQDLLTAIGALDCTVKPFAFQSHAPAAEQRICPQAADELRAAARWAARLLQEEPQVRVAIVCRNLQGLQPMLQTIMRQEFANAAPGSWQVLEQHGLDSEPFGHTALQALRLLDAEVDTLELCALLRSPWLRGAEEEAEARCALEFHLRERSEVLTPMVRFRELCTGRQEGIEAPQLAAALLQLHSRKLRQPQQQPFASWLALLHACWQLLLDEDALLRQGMPALYRGWKRFLERLERIAWLQPECSLTEAIAVLRCLAAAESVHAVSDAARVLVLSPLATAGQRFTHLWCLQMDERNWPAEQKPSPWLPWHLQQQYDMPGIDPDTALASATRQLQLLQENSCVQFIASYSQVEDDCQLRPSPLLAGIPARAEAGSILPASLHPDMAGLPLAACEVVEDALHVPLGPDLFTGDAALPAHQAACPFRAFALYRLRATRLATPRLGLPPGAFGSTLHKMMELFWDALGSSQALGNSDPAALLQHIEDCASKALARTARRYPVTLRPRFRALEQARLVTLLQQWLPQELQRGDFTVLATEHDCQWRHETLQLNFRIDRVDRDDAGLLVVVDYKSGRLPKVDWEAERQDEPQLLLYLQALEQAGEYTEPVAALLYARLHAEEPGYRGIGASTAICPGIDFEADHKLGAPHWQALKEHWLASTRLLASEFLQGAARVAPLRRNTCTHCHLQALCRIGEQAQPADDDDAGNHDVD